MIIIRAVFVDKTGAKILEPVAFFVLGCCLIWALFQLFFGEKAIYGVIALIAAFILLVIGLALMLVASSAARKATIRSCMESFDQYFQNPIQYAFILYLTEFTQVSERFSTVDLEEAKKNLFLDIPTDAPRQLDCLSDDFWNYYLYLDKLGKYQENFVELPYRQKLLGQNLSQEVFQLIPKSHEHYPNELRAEILEKIGIGKKCLENYLDQKLKQSMAPILKKCDDCFKKELKSGSLESLVKVVGIRSACILYFDFINMCVINGFAASLRRESIEMKGSIIISILEYFGKRKGMSKAVTQLLSKVNAKECPNDLGMLEDYIAAFHLKSLSTLKEALTIDSSKHVAITI